MDIKELLNKHRDYYLKHFIDLLAKFGDGESELLLESKNNEPVELFRLYRYDFVTKNEDNEFKITEFNTDGYLNHHKAKFSFGGKVLTIDPIVWNGVEISIDSFSEGFEEINKWAYKWLNIEDKNTKDSNELQGVIHNITKPEKENDWLTFSVDFGSAPLESTIELLDIILNNEVTKKIKLESKWMTKERSKLQ